MIYIGKEIHTVSSYFCSLPIFVAHCGWYRVQLLSRSYPHRSYEPELIFVCDDYPKTLPWKQYMMKSEFSHCISHRLTKWPVRRETLHWQSGHSFRSLLYRQWKPKWMSDFITLEPFSARTRMWGPWLVQCELHSNFNIAYLWIPLLALNLLVVPLALQ
jgi:hypothetical protein